jgi:type I restriction enzyme, S subunit
VSFDSWLEAMPDAWHSKRLKYAAPTRTARAEGVSGDQTYIGLENIQSWTGKFVASSESIASDEDSVDSSGTSNSFQRGDVLFGKLRPYLAKAFLADRDGICTTELLVLQPQEELEAKYLLYALLRPEFVTLVDSSTFGARMPRANWDFIGNIQIPLPPLKLQRRIADYLDAETTQIDALILEKERMLDLLEEKRAALISQAVTKGLDAGVKMKDSGLEWMGKVPAHWKLERLKFSLSGIEQGWSPQCNNFPALPDSWGVLKVGAVNQWEFNADENKSLPDELEPITEYEIQAGNVLMSRANTTQLVGRASYIREVRPKLLLCDKLYRLQILRNRINPEFLVRFLGTRPGRFEFERDASGSSNSMQNIGQDSVYNLLIILPSLEEQDEIVQHINQSVKRLDIVTREITTSLELLRERRSALITAAVTGQLEIDGVSA